MKILLIGNYEKDQQYSMQKFSECLHTALIENGNQIILLKPTVIFGSLFKSTLHGVGKWFGYIDKYLIFPIILYFKAKWPDITHICDHSNSIYIHIIKDYPHLVTCHDMLAIRSALGEFKSYNKINKIGKIQQFIILNGLKKTKHIAAVSNATKQDLTRIIQKTSQIKVIYNGLNYPYKKLSREESLCQLQKYNLTCSNTFLLHVGGNQWYKNKKSVLYIFSELINIKPELKLVLAGKPISKELSEIISKLNLNDHITFITDPSNSELNALYSLSSALIFPSLYEGFGWPILEAQASGTLVFTSNFEPMTEVGGNAAIYIDPTNVIESSLIIAKTLSEPDKVNIIKKNNDINVKKFDTQIMTKDYVKFYTEIISSHDKK